MRRCLFCTDAANTKEDAFPMWLQEVVRPSHGAAHGRMQVWRGPTSVPLIWGGPKAAIKVRCVCKGCNNGWMSTLESVTKPVLAPLVSDLTYSLESTDQMLLALWTIKTAMVFEAAKEGTPMFYTETERAALLTTFAPPLETIIWIGRYAHHIAGYGETRRLSDAIAKPPHKESPLGEACVTTFAFGHAILHAISIRRKPGASGTAKTTMEVQRGPWSELLRQIWPIQQKRVTWPPPSSFNDHGPTLEELGQRYTRKV